MNKAEACDMRSLAHLEAIKISVTNFRARKATILSSFTFVEKDSGCDLVGNQNKYLTLA